MAGLKDIIVYNGYPLSVFLALSLHSLVLAALLYFQMERQEQVRDIVITPMVRALLIEENPQVRNEQLLEQQRLVRVEEQQRVRDAEQQRIREQQQQAEAEQQREQALAAQQQRERDAAAQRERQQEVDQQRQTELAAEQERQREAERQRQRELAAEQDRQRQRDADTQAATAEAARTESELVMAYTSVIHDLVQQNWSRPPSARNGMEVVIRLRMVPTGDVLDAEIIRSSGDAAFDRAAETAIFRVGQFRELQGMPINLFNTNFRTFLMTFRPEDLLN